MTYRLLHANDFWIPLSKLVVITMMGCNSQENAELVIDQRSYNLGRAAPSVKWWMLALRNWP